jgi:hypothetical protein
MEESEKEPTSLQDGVIRWLGQFIFPQPFHELDEKFGLAILVEMSKKGLIVKSEAHASFGSRFITTARPSKRYIELSDKGWEEYERLTS